MDLGLHGKKALVFGGSRGMGKACALQLSQEGVHVTIAARNEANLQAAAAEISQRTGNPVRYVVADLTRAEGRDAALAALPDPDIVLLNADGPKPGDFRDWTPEVWHAALDSMMVGPIDMMRRCVDGMVQRKFGRIINIVSRSVKTPQLEMGLSNGARSGLVGFVAGLARQTVAHNVTINNILPGVFDTDAQRQHIRGMLEMTGKSYEQLWEERARSNPAGRYGRPEEVGAMCAYLASVHTGFVTGQSILIDGGGYPGTF